MIRREDNDDWILIPQVKHARLADELASAWIGFDNSHLLPMSKHLLPAIHSHDEGWIEWDEQPEMNSDTGVPRSFLEMPMSVSTDLWRKSIAYCSGLRKENVAASIRHFQRFLTRSGRRLTRQRAYIIEVIFSMRVPFGVDELTIKLADHSESQGLSKATLIRLLSLLEAADMLKKLHHSHGAILYHPPGVDRLLSPFGGMWVSLFFCDLARRANEHRASDKDHQAIKLFQNEQHEHQQLLLQTIEENFTETLKMYEREGINDWQATGLQWLQFFDRLSLWLCCKQETETFHITIPQTEGTKLHLTPLDSGEIAVEPFPFDENQLRLSTIAKKNPSQTLFD